MLKFLNLLKIFIKIYRKFKTKNIIYKFIKNS